MLTHEEYFQLEAHEWKKKELEYEKQLLQLKKEIAKRDLTILQFNIDGLRRKAGELDDRILTLNVKIENVQVSKDKTSSKISERLGLETNDWGYDPTTLEIIE